MLFEVLVDVVNGQQDVWHIVTAITLVVLHITLVNVVNKGSLIWFIRWSTRSSIGLEFSVNITSFVK